MAYTRRIQMLLYDPPCGLSLLEMVLNVLQVSAIGICRVSLHGYLFNCSLKLQTLSADTISIKTTQTLTISSSFCFHYVCNCN